MRSARRATALLAGLVAAALPGLAVMAASPGAADTAPPSRDVPATVSADALPTVQVDGVVWSQAVAGDVVYAGGNFTTARPAGAAAGTKTVDRTNLLAFDIRTGVLVSSFAPALNGQVTAVAASADGKRVYVGGSFTTVDGQKRSRFAAFDTATGALVKAVAPRFNSSVSALAVSGSTVYVGGAFTTASGVARARLAAVSTVNGAVTKWAPGADASVSALVATPDGKGVVVGGHFTQLAGESAPGLGAVDATTGESRAFEANTVIKDSGVKSGITSLTTDGHLVYGTGYDFGGGNFEGTFAADPSDGSIVWIEDCRGDTYAAAPAGDAIYTVSHAHDCSSSGGFPETNPRTWHRAAAFSTDAKGVVSNSSTRWSPFAGRPAPQLLTWWPLLSAGTFTKQSQAAWSVVATDDYVVLGGEFPKVNGKGQQGLVRFAVRSEAPNKSGPVDSGKALGLTATAQSDGTVDLTWKQTWDRDNEQLTYTLVRVGVSAPLVSRTASSSFWELGTMKATDDATAPGSRSYRLSVKDPLGNTVKSALVTVTVPAPSA
ncbi:MAG TPA: hypothetical protein VE781_13025 [Kineosporiaceae bacterium]|jgi:hypothetical protein|nr:hypothetical protein [Kineosporiaceae bacterium]